VIEKAVSASLNHLLESESWAREKLAPFAGETVELRAPFLPPLRLAIEESGLTRAAKADGSAASLVIALKPDAPAALLRGEEHFLRAVEVTGNAKLAEEVRLLARHLRWDFEEDLSRLVGDVAAHRLAESARAFGAWQADAARRLAESFGDYATQESGLLVRRLELDALAGATARLRDAIERLEQRIRRLG
jgi:ubiquinone biosynthesis accessory factor UbiJ